MAPVTFERKVSLDTLITLAGLLVAGVIFWSKLDTRITVVEGNVTSQQKLIEQLSKSSMDTQLAVRDLTQFAKIFDRMELVQVKPTRAKE